MKTASVMVVVVLLACGGEMSSPSERLEPNPTVVEGPSTTPPVRYASIYCVTEDAAVYWDQSCEIDAGCVLDDGTEGTCQ